MEKTKITVPNGTRDLIFEEVTAERELEGRIDGLLDVLGYRPVRTPSVEYYDLFDQSNRYIDETQMYKLTDGDGRLIVLRPDNTAPIARLVSSKLHAEPLPLLIRYGQRVFRSSAAYNALRHEVLQYGVEVIGGDRRSEDLRVLFTAFETLSLCGGDYKIEIGHAQFFDALIDTLELSADEKKAVKAYLAAKNSSMMPFGVSAGQSRALDIARRLPRLCGGAEVLEESRRLAGGLCGKRVQRLHRKRLCGPHHHRYGHRAAHRILYGPRVQGLYRRHRRAGAFGRPLRPALFRLRPRKNRLRLRVGRVRRRRIARRVP